MPEDSKRRRADYKSPSAWFEQKVVQLDTDYKHLEASFEQHTAAISRRLEGIETAIDKLFATMAKSRQISWPFIISLLVGAVVVFGAINHIATSPLWQAIDGVNMRFTYEAHIRNLQLQKQELRLITVWRSQFPARAIPWSDDDYYPIVTGTKENSARPVR